MRPIELLLLRQERADRALRACRLSQSCNSSLCSSFRNCAKTFKIKPLNKFK